MRPILIVLTTCVCILSAACATETSEGMQRSATMDKIARITAKPWLFRGGTVFQAPMPAKMVTDTLSQRVFERNAIPMAHSWGFVKAPADPHTDPHWQRVVFNAVEGVGIGESSWNKEAAGMFKGMQRMAPGGSMVDSVITWRPDTAEYHFGWHDATKGEFLNLRCIGTKADRPRSIVVCVRTAAETQEALASVRDGLKLISRRDQRPGR